MAYAFCIAKAYADDVIGRGLHVDEFAGRLSYNFNLFGNLFDNIQIGHEDLRFVVRLPVRIG